MNKIKAAASSLFLSVMVLAGCSNTQKTNTFVPKLDTQASVTLNCASFFENFEALDQVLVQFNEYYPNVNLVSDRYSSTADSNFLVEKPQYDIIMVSNEKGFNLDYLLDLESAGIDFSDINQDIINGNRYKGVLYSLPMSLDLNGLVVNKTLLRKYNLEVPETWNEFLNVLEVLKNAGLTSIQGPTTAMSSLSTNMIMCMLASDSSLLESFNSKNKEGSQKLTEAFTKIETLYSDGYISNEVNAEYPDDNYNNAILKFFEGDVAFWVCNTEKVSGMKKRESRSDAFKANPFEYEFVFAPLGEKGAYKYFIPWNGFAINKNSTRKDYAVEFLRFMATKQGINTMASVKGVPSIAKETDDDRYNNIYNTKSELSVVRSSTVPDYYRTLIYSSTSKLIRGEVENASQALDDLLERIYNSLNG